MRGRQYFRMIGKTEIIIGTKVDYGLWSAAISNHRAGVCAGEELRLI
jgi:hypothetical protein